MATQIIAGRINANGSTAAGTGFYVRPLNNGTFIVEFDRPLPAVPAVVLCQNYLGWTDFPYPGGDTRDNAVLAAVDEKGFRVLTGNYADGPVNRNFAFIAAVTAAESMIPPIAWGAVSSGGSVSGTAGVQSRKIGNGTYFIDFNQSFTRIDSVVLTQNFPGNFNNPLQRISTLDNAAIVAVDEHHMKYITGDSFGTKVDRGCLFVAVGQRNESMPPGRIMYGNVNADGTVRNGSSNDFQVDKRAGGGYAINFAGAFARPPAVLVTQNFPAWSFDPPLQTGSPLDNAVVYGVDQSVALIVTGDGSGAIVDRNFSFIAVG